MSKLARLYGLTYVLTCCCLVVHCMGSRTHLSDFRDRRLCHSANSAWMKTGVPGEDRTLADKVLETSALTAELPKRKCKL